jgi:hypothetical protein
MYAYHPSWDNFGGRSQILADLNTTTSDAAGVELWDFRQIMREIDVSIRGKRSYFTDDTLRTISLFARATNGPTTVA